jgi:hypothetical protein
MSPAAHVRVAIVAALSLAASRPALADPGNDTPTDPSGNVQPDSGSYSAVKVPDQVVVKGTPDRSPKNVAVLATLAGVGAVVGGLGLWAHLESRQASSNVSAADFTNEEWSVGKQAEQDRANSDATKAAVAYSIGGAFVIAAIVALIVTAPQEQTVVLGKHAGIVPTPNGATAYAAWSF